MSNLFFKRIIPIIALSLIFCSIPTGFKSYAQTSKVVRVGYYNNEAFQDGSSDEDIKTGYAYEYYRKISEYTGWNYEYVYGDFVTIYQMLLKGEVDVVAGLAYTDERSSLILYPDKPMGFEKYTLIKHDDDRTITSELSTITDKKIGVLDSAISETLNNFLAGKSIDAEVKLFNDYETLLKAFDKKEIDLIAAESDGIYNRNHAEVLFSFGESDYYIGIAKDHSDLLYELNKAQTLLFSEYPGYIDTLRNKYYPSTLSSRAFTKSEMEWLSSHKELKVGYLNDFLPFCDTDKDGNVTGMISDLVPYLFSKLGLHGIEFEFVPYDNYDDIASALTEGSIDVGFPVGGGLYFSEVDGMYLTNPVLTSVTDLVYSDKYRGNNDEGFAACENNKLQYYYIKTNYPDSKIIMYPTLEKCMDAVLSGEATCTTVCGLRTSSVLKNRKYQKLSFIQLNNSEDHCFGVKIGNDGLLKLLNRGINITGSDYIQNLAFDYSNNIYKYSIIDFILDYFWQFSLALVIIVLIIIYLLYIDIKRNRNLAHEKELARIRIEKADHEKFIFVNNMTNYMREPMSKLVSLIDSAKRTDDIDKIGNSLDEMSDQTRTLITMINNITSMTNSSEDNK